MDFLYRNEKIILALCIAGLALAAALARYVDTQLDRTEKECPCPTRSSAKVE